MLYTPFLIPCLPAFTAPQQTRFLFPSIPLGSPCWTQGEILRAIFLSQMMQEHLISGQHRHTEKTTAVDQRRHWWFVSVMQPRSLVLHVQKAAESRGPVKGNTAADAVVTGCKSIAFPRLFYQWNDILLVELTTYELRCCLCLLNPILLFYVFWWFFYKRKDKCLLWLFLKSTGWISASMSLFSFQPNMLRSPAQFWCLLHLNPVTVKSIPHPTWRTAGLMFAPAPVARIVCALPLLIMQQPVLGRPSWSSGENLTSAVSETLLAPTCFPYL